MDTITPLLENTDTIINGFVQGSFNNVSAIIYILWKSMFIIFIAITGYKVILSGNFKVSENLTHIFRIIIILVLATSWTEFQLFIMNIMTNVPSEIAGTIMQGGIAGGGDVADANTALGNFYERGVLMSSQIVKGAGWNILLIFYSVAVLLATVALTGYAIMLIILAKLAVAILLSVAPFFILMLIFTQSKSLFEGWLRSLLNYALIPIFVYGLLAILLQLVELPLALMESNVSSTSQILSVITPFILISGISIMLLTQVMHISSSITGGISLSTIGIGRMAGRKLGSGTKTIGGYSRGRADNVADKVLHTGSHSSENRLKNALPRSRGSNR